MNANDQRTVTIVEEGRIGRVHYRERAGELSFAWEFGGGDVVVIVHVGTPAEWNASNRWAAERRTEIVRFVAAELVRQKAPACRAEIDDEVGCLYLRQTAPASAPSPTTSFSMARLRRLRSILAGVVLAGAMIAAAGLWLGQKLLSIDPGKGTAVGLSVRADRCVATLIQTLEPYIPSLNRDHSRDRYRLSLFLVPLDGTRTRLLPVRGDLSANDVALARILGSDGRTLWYDTGDIGGVDLATFRVLGDEDVRRFPPPPELQGYRPLTHASDPAQYLSAGFFPAANTWLGLHSEAEVKRDYQPNKWVRRIVPADDANVLRRFHRGTLEPDESGKYYRIVRFAPVVTPSISTRLFSARTTSRNRCA